MIMKLYHALDAKHLGEFYAQRDFCLGYYDEASTKELLYKLNRTYTEIVTLYEHTPTENKNILLVHMLAEFFAIEYHLIERGVI